MKQQFLPTTVQEIPEILMDDDIDVAIVKLMSSFKSYTTDEVFNLLRERVHDPDAIRPTMLALYTDGWFDMRTLTGDVTVYSLKRWRTLESLQADTKRPTKIRRFKQPEVPAVDPAGRVLLSDGIDVAIWKVMQDRRWRSVKSVVEMLREFGFERAAVDRRFDTLIRSNRMFDRTGFGATRNYRLKADFKCPVPERQQDEVKLVETPEPQNTPKEASVAVTPAARVVKESVTASDTLYEALAKVMSDGEEYSTNDLCVLLSDFGFRFAQISPSLSTLFQKGNIFDRRKVAGKGKLYHYVYRLKPGAQMPVARKSRDASEQQVSKQTAPQPEQTVMTNAAPQNETPALLQVVAAAPIEKPSLFDLTIHIKGVEISINEFAQLYKELKAQGFGNPLPKSGMLIEAQYVIKGANFTRAELDALVETFNSTARGFQKCFS